MARTPNLRMPLPPLPGLTPRRWLHLPSRTVRLRLTLLYSGLFLASGMALLATVYLLFRNSTGVDLIVPNGPKRPRPLCAEWSSSMPRLSLFIPTVFTRALSSPRSRWPS